jgi:hypothetical protein
MDPTPSPVTERNGQPVLQTEPAWLPGAQSVPGIQNPSVAIPVEPIGTSAASERPKHSRAKRAGIALGSLVVLAALAAGGISDIGARQTLGSTQKQLTATTQKLTVATQKLTGATQELMAENAMLAGQTGQISDLRVTVSSQQQQLQSASGKNQQLTACVGAVNAVFHDMARNAALTVFDRDYSAAYRICGTAGQTLP